jgi:CD63 antigen
MVSGGMTCVKYLLFVFNLLFFVSGVVMLAIGAVIYVVYAHYYNFVYDSFQSAPLILIIVGVIIFLVAFFGCCGACKENHCMIITFSVLLLVIFTLEVGTGIAGYIRRNEVETMLENKLNSTMFDYYNNEKIKETWDIAQHEAKCCGMNGPDDWRRVIHNDTLPHTCCPDTPDDGSCTNKSPNVYKDACYFKLKEVFTKYGSIIGGVGIGIAICQLMGVIFACCLARSIRQEYETV